MMRSKPRSICCGDMQYGSKVSGYAVVTDNDAVLVIAVSGRIKPFCAVLFINAAFFLKEFASLTDFVGIMQGLLAEPYIEGYAGKLPSPLSGLPAFLYKQFPRI